MIRKLKEMIEESNHIVFFGGAGVSTESGIPDFRSTDGIYQQEYEYPPETIVSRLFFKNHGTEFFRFYRDKMICLDARPNYAHKFLVKLEQQGKLEGIITQNIDNLHYMAGSKKVFELHGNAQKNHCMKCKKSYGIEKILAEEFPRCECGGRIKPDVVLYGEELPMEAINGAIKAMEQSDLLIVAGTSLSVYPAASFLDYYKGNKIVVINKSELPVKADLVFQEAVGEVFRKVDELSE